MSRFLPKLFLRSRPKPILAPLPAACRQGNFCHLVFSRTRRHQVAYNFALQCCQTLPKVAARLKVCILHSRGGHSQSRTLHCGSSSAGMEFVCVEGQYCPRARMAVPNIPHFNYLAALSTSQQRSRGRVGSCLLSGYNPTICSLTSTP